jgi:hypothetical protein
MRRSRVQLVSAADVCVTVRFGDDLFVVCAEDTLRGARETAAFTTDGLRIEAADDHQQWLERNDLVEHERYAHFRLRHLPKRRRPCLRLVKPGSKT